MTARIRVGTLTAQVVGETWHSSNANFKDECQITADNRPQQYEPDFERAAAEYVAQVLGGVVLSYRKADDVKNRIY